MNSSLKAVLLLALANCVLTGVDYEDAAKFKGCTKKLWGEPGSDRYEWEKEKNLTHQFYMDQMGCLLGETAALCMNWYKEASSHDLYEAIMCDVGKVYKGNDEKIKKIKDAVTSLWKKNETKGEKLGAHTETGNQINNISFLNFMIKVINTFKRESKQFDKGRLIDLSEMDQPSTGSNKGLIIVTSVALLFAVIFMVVRKRNAKNYDYLPENDPITLEL